MSYVAQGFLSALQQRLRSARGWIVLLLLPALVLTVRLCLPPQEVTAPVQVGVALPEEGGEELWTLLERRSGTVLTFVLADQDTIDRNVAAGRWDCGVVLAEDFDRRIEAGDTDKLFTLRIAEGSSVYYLVQETVSACTAELIAPGMGAQYLEKNGITPGDGLAQMEARLETVDQIVVVMKTADGQEMDPLQLGSTGLDTVLQWLILAVLLVWMLLCTADLGRYGVSDPVRRMKPLRPMTGLLAGKIAADAAIGGVSAICAMAVLGAGLAGCTAVVAYVLLLGGTAVLLARAKPVWSALPMLPPFAVVVSLLLSGALVDVSSALPAVRWVPGYLFLRICRGEYLAALPLVAAGAACVGFSAILDKVKK